MHHGMGINIYGVQNVWKLFRWLPTLHRTPDIIHIQEHTCNSAHISAIAAACNKQGYHTYSAPATASTTATIHTTACARPPKRPRNDHFYGGIMTLAKHGQPTHPHTAQHGSIGQLLALRIHGKTHINVYRGHHDYDESIQHSIADTIIALGTNNSPTIAGDWNQTPDQLQLPHWLPQSTDTWSPQTPPLATTADASSTTSSLTLQTPNYSNT